MEIGRLNN